VQSQGEPRDAAVNVESYNKSIMERLCYAKQGNLVDANRLGENSKIIAQKITVRRPSSQNP